MIYKDLEEDTAIYDSSQKGGSIQGTLFIGGGGSVIYGGINQSFITDIKDAGRPTTAIETGITTTTINAGSIGYSVQITGKDNE